MEENCSIKLFESDLESMLSQVLAQGSHSSIFTDTAVQRTYYVKTV